MGLTQTLLHKNSDWTMNSCRCRSIVSPIMPLNGDAHLPTMPFHIVQAHVLLFIKTMRGWFNCGALWRFKPLMVVCNSRNSPNDPGKDTWAINTQGNLSKTVTQFKPYPSATVAGTSLNVDTYGKAHGNMGSWSLYSRYSRVILSEVAVPVLTQSRLFDLSEHSIDNPNTFLNWSIRCKLHKQ